jgi:hypothetical protein
MVLKTYACFNPDFEYC